MEKKPFIGQLDRKIEIVQVTTNLNDLHEDVPTETKVFEPYAKMEDVSGGEEVEGKVIHLVDRKYTIRYRQEIALLGHEMILKDAGQSFRIEHVKQIGRKSYLELICKRNE